MAISGIGPTGTEFEFAISEESTFGTAITATTTDTWKLLHITEVPQWDLSGIVRDSTMRLRGSRVPHNTDNYVTRAGGTILIPFTCIVTDITYDLLIYGVMQDLVSEEVGTPFEKIWEWDSATTEPDFASNGGKFYTVVLNGGISSEDFIATSCILRDLTISSDPGTNGGRMTASGTFISGLSSSTKFLESGSQAFGTATQPGTTYFNHCNLVTKKIGGTDMIVESYSITYNNKAVRKGCDSSGDAQGYTLGAGGYEVTGTIRVLYDANSKGLITNSLTSGFDTQMILAYGSAADPVTTDGDLLQKININIPQTPRDFAAEVGTMLDVNFTGADDGTDEMVENEFANAVDRGW
ncbi:MAG: hypothetical protein IIA60_07990 [Candidatus Marinimicrobia bacterium]|nr:hypothetical protein [Candidatus Neomarinimicrobiota bacterium]